MSASGYNEEDFVEAVLRLRKLHWSCAEEKMKYIADKYSSEETFFVSEVTAISHGNLRFDAIKLPKSECKISLLQYSHGEGFIHASQVAPSQMITPRPSSARIPSTSITMSSSSSSSASTSISWIDNRATIPQAIPMKRVYPSCN